MLVFGIITIIFVSYDFIYTVIILAILKISQRNRRRVRVIIASPE